MIPPIMCDSDTCLIRKCRLQNSPYLIEWCRKIYVANEPLCDMHTGMAVGDVKK